MTEQIWIFCFVGLFAKFNNARKTKVRSDKLNCSAVDPIIFLGFLDRNFREKFSSIFICTGETGIQSGDDNQIILYDWQEEEWKANVLLFFFFSGCEVLMLSSSNL